LRAHLKGALTNGVTRDEIREILMQVAIYGGMPAAVDSFRIARELFAETRQGLRPIVMDIGLSASGTWDFPWPAA